MPPLRNRLLNLFVNTVETAILILFGFSTVPKNKERKAQMKARGETYNEFYGLVE